MTADMESWARDTGKAIREAREKAGMTLSGLADRTAELGFHVHRVTISKIETGVTTGFTLAQIKVIALALEIPAMDLLFPDHYHVHDLYASELRRINGEYDGKLQMLRRILGGDL
ncbi:helix-turn-helix domain-containing protein [Gordonia tangerina]|uniref:Helix-turn-helix domain-containing protein n=1 Tax=Gordonia tangerina TaxID=2911060 RepID=A0ABS9DLI5_9ACTN|nr:helix-turn-helix transcriptional regulator [Gordonia tangerina]MCF3939958.1 helix-turn-helix domain-containing protein [Gordonia tangerina]